MWSVLQGLAKPALLSLAFFTTVYNKLGKFGVAICGPKSTRGHKVPFSPATTVANP